MYTLVLGERSRGFALYFYTDMQRIHSKGLQKPNVRGVSYRRRKTTVSQVTFVDVIRGVASFSMTSTGFFLGLFQLAYGALELVYGS